MILFFFRLIKNGCFAGKSKPAAAAFAADDDVDMEEGEAWGDDNEYLVGDDGELETDGVDAGEEVS